MNALEIINISKSYTDTVAVDDISFTVGASELFGLIGPDGAGKTTLLRIITTLLLPDKGDAKLLGYDIIKDYKTLRTKIGYMPQKFSLYPDLTVKENLNFFATVFNTTVKENYYIIKDIYSQIEMFQDRKAGDLSGGMKQKLGLCCALIHKPEILILDEPTTGVDAVSRKEFWEMLRKLKEIGIPIIVSTPYMDEASLCDRVALIQKGKILTIDYPNNLADQIKDKLFEIKSDELYKLQKALRKKYGYSSSFLFGQSIHFLVKNKNIVIDDIKKVAKKSGVLIKSFKEIPATTEDCFIHLTNESELLETNTINN